MNDDDENPASAEALVAKSDLKPSGRTPQLPQPGMMILMMMKCDDNEN